MFNLSFFRPTVVHVSNNLVGASLLRIPSRKSVGVLEAPIPYNRRSCLVCHNDAGVTVTQGCEKRNGETNQRQWDVKIPQVIPFARWTKAALCEYPAAVVCDVRRGCVVFSFMLILDFFYTDPKGLVVFWNFLRGGSFTITLCNQGTLDIIESEMMGKGFCLSKFRN